MNQMTTGASNDFESAPPRWRAAWSPSGGMSDVLGPMTYSENEGEVFLGRSVTTHQAISDETMQKVDKEIRRIIDEQYHLARRLLEENRDKVEAMTKALLEWETLDAEQVSDIMEGRPPRRPSRWRRSPARRPPTAARRAPSRPPAPRPPRAPEPCAARHPRTCRPRSPPFHSRSAFLRALRALRVLRDEASASIRVFAGRKPGVQHGGHGECRDMRGWH